MNLRVHRTRIHARSTPGIIVSSLECSFYSLSFLSFSFLFLRFCLIDVSYYCTLFPRYYSRFAHSLLSPYFILLLYNHFSCFFSTSFRREPHLLSIFARWLCIEDSFSWDQRVRNIMRYAGESLIFLFFFLSSFLLLFAFNLHRRIPPPCLPFKRTYKGKFTRGLLRGLQVQSSCKVDW